MGSSFLMREREEKEELTVRARYLYTYAQLRKHPLTHAQNKKRKEFSRLSGVLFMHVCVCGCLCVYSVFVHALGDGFFFFACCLILFVNSSAIRTFPICPFYLRKLMAALRPSTRSPG